ncbi:ABC-ATPase UvrA [Allorhodopirellula solitaria]|uniref:UvrABC system protein A n=1 Tax=Allorhodopirellula solitaria TaxID=2527987 RepID=A0A5C5WZN7_9BACT|nr:ABC-ATPase UvrA [Allorhodopirellula solitaria]TWT56126.1 UvrABC system protein A [Allorhodopirellula solitaria]
MRDPAADSTLTAPIRIHGARVHNLKNVSVDIPRNQLTVITGVSGSGKSSLAFDTLFAEGQRQYIDTLSTYARQYLDAIPRPDVDLIEGLAPTLSIDQKSGSQSARSTVATVTEIYDYLRLLFARVGIPHCTECGSAVSTQTPDAIIESLGAYPPRTKLTLMSPMVRGRKGRHTDVLEKIAAHGLVRARVDGEVFLLEDVPPLAVRKNHTIEAVVDRIVVKAGIEARLDESTRLAIRLSGGLCAALVETPDGDSHSELFSTTMACVQCGASMEELEPRTFSFNSPYGACPTCDGLGVVEQSSADNRTASKRSAGKQKPAARKSSKKTDPQLTITCPTCLGGRLRPEALAVSIAGESLPHVVSMPLLQTQDWMKSITESLSELHQRVAAPIQDEVVRRIEFLCRVGVDYLTLDRSADTLSGGELQRIRLASCIGSGLVSVCYVLDEPSIGLHPADHDRLLDAIGELKDQGNTIVIVEHDEDTMRAADYLIDIGPGAGVHGGYIVSQGTPDEVANDPASPTGRYLAGKEPIVARRLRPSEKNNQQPHPPEEAIVDRRLRPSEVDNQQPHPPEESIVDRRFRPSEVDNQQPHPPEEAIVDRRLRPSEKNNQQPRPSTKSWLTLRGASLHNLDNVTLKLPLGNLIGVSGVSGSGKSSLIVDTLYPALAAKLGLVAKPPGKHSRLIGAEKIDKLIPIDQSPIGRTSRSCPATYAGVLDPIRNVFASTRAAKTLGFSASRFSFNSPAGRCDLCKGNGFERIEMNFLSDLLIECSRCGGKRFNRQTLQVRFKGATIADVLNMTVEAALEFFENVPKVKTLLSSLFDVGLGYVTLGQSSTTLSGGEAQRIKLATELARPGTGSTLYLLDEPTTGLHFSDVQRLLTVLDRLVEAGNTVVVIEHHTDLLAACDWLVDLGPRGGEGGGRIIAAGPPSDIAACPDSLTGEFLSKKLAAKN